MEEECGNLEQSLLVLRKGARTNHSYNEVLLTKAIKQHERLNNLTGAREMLGKLQEEGIDTTWRTVLEGSLLESRAGNIAMARKLLSALMSRVSWYGPIYHEAFRLEEKAENFDNALAVVQRGLHELPRYGPLWFGLLRIMERKDMLDEANEWTTGEYLPLLKRTRSESQNAICSISRELVWKVHFEQAQIEERAMEIVALGRHLSTGKSLLACRDELSSAARKCYTQSLMTCPANLRWKVYLAGSRLEMAADQIDTAHLLLRQAKLEVPDKSKYHVFLECSRLEEFLGNIDAARKILWISRREIKNEWKLYLEAVLVEARAGNLVGAIYLADKALSMDSGSGRLWALLVQLVHRCEWRNKLLLGQEMTKQKQKDEIEDRLDCAEITPPSDYKIPSKYTILCRALCVVPKSGEVWCEGARTLLNPLSMKYFDLGKAQKYLSFSIQFTPQYGDSFIEYIRLEMLTQILLPRVLFLLGVPVNFFFSLLDNFDLESDSSKSLKNIREMVEVAFSGSHHLLRSNPKDNVALAKNGLLDIGHCREALEKISIANLTRRYCFLSHLPSLSLTSPPPSISIPLIDVSTLIQTTALHGSIADADPLTLPVLSYDLPSPRSCMSSSLLNQFTSMRSSAMSFEWCLII
jgi:tetratricopeptide (TPR) repeat protein